MLVASPSSSEESLGSAVLELLQPVVGERRSELVAEGDTLLDIALRNGVGFEALARLNPDMDVWLPAPGSVVVLPTLVILPNVERQGIVINIPELRLFDFTLEPGPEVLAAAVGDVEDPTPTGEFQIRDKRVDPVWTVPKSILAERPGHPATVPPGPENPLGTRWMRIGTTSTGIHGTNSKWSIGREATHGCVRLYEEDVQRLFERTPEGTRLQMVYQPYKWGREGSKILFEAHPDRYGFMTEPLTLALVPLRAMDLLHLIDVERVWKTIEEARGVPVEVGQLPPDLMPPPAGRTPRAGAEAAMFGRLARVSRERAWLLP